MRARVTERGARAGRGFTVVEVLVALSAGVLVSMAAFMLSKNATAFFQREARISSAQLGLTLAMNRLTADIQRAAFLSSPNVMTDPAVCRQTSSTWPAGLTALSGISIAHGAQATTLGAAQNPPMAAPDQIIIGGSMDSNEVYQVQSILSGAGGAPLLVMRGPTTEPATYRALASLGAGETLSGKLTPTFYPSTYPAPTLASGRFAHIYQPESNFHWFGVIDTFTIDSTSGAINVQLKQTPSLPVKPANTCGLSIGDTGGGWFFSVVSRVQYDIRTLTGTLPSSSQYSQIVAAVQPKVTRDDLRTELVRTELDASNNLIAGSMELVAEFAVDLRFGITVGSLVTNDNYNPTVTSYAIGDPNVYSISAATPQRIRAVQVRLATRTRAPDRETDLPAGPDGRRMRVLVDPALQPAYARVRTNYANVALPNQGGFSLW